LNGALFLSSVYLLNSFSSPHLVRVGRVLLGVVVGGMRNVNVSERRRLCSRCVNSTSLQLPRVMNNSGLLYLLVIIFDGGLTLRRLLWMV